MLERLRTIGLNFLMVLEAEFAGLVCIQPPSHYVFTVSFVSACMGEGELRERTSFLVLFFIKTLILKDQGFTLMTSFNLSYFLRGPISKYSHTGRLRFQHMNCEEDIFIQSIIGNE